MTSRSGQGAQGARPLVVVMGVSGSGKTTVGEELARRLDVPFAEGDDFHEQRNVDRMQAGVPLDDADRWPWLAAIAAWLADHAVGGGVATCSALRRAYRDVLRSKAPDVVFLHLAGEEAVIRRRLEQRTGHFMPPDLLRSQFQALEPLEDDEPGIVVDLAASVDEIVETALDALTHPTPRRR